MYCSYPIAGLENGATELGFATKMRPKKERVFLFSFCDYGRQRFVLCVFPSSVCFGLWKDVVFCSLSEFVVVRMNRGFNPNLFTDPATFPTNETGDPPSPRSTYPVIRLQSRFPGLKAKHLRAAVKAYLSARCGVQLARDTGPGKCICTARLDPALFSRGMALARESCRAAFLRRVVYWHFYQKQIEAEAAKRPSVAPSSSKPVAPAAAPASVPASSWCGRSLVSPAIVRRS